MADETTELGAVSMHQPDPDVIDELKLLLQQAEAGKLLGFGAVCLFSGGTTGWRRRGLMGFPEAIGQFELAKRRLIDEWLLPESDEGDDEDGDG